MPTSAEIVNLALLAMHEEHVANPAVWDAMTAAMIFGTGAVVVGGPHDAYGRGVVNAEVFRARDLRYGIRERRADETLVEWRVRLWRRPMFTLKDDDPQITWDDKAMAARPFRERKG